MRILLIDQIATVNYKYTFNLCNELKKQGVDVDLIIDNKKYIDECKVNVINLFNTADKKISKFVKVVNYIKSALSIIKLIKLNKYEVLHVQWFTLSPIDYLYIKKAKKYGIKIIVTIHDILPFNQKFYDFKFHNKIYGIADEIIVQAENNKKRFKEIFPKYSNKIHFIPHGNFLNYAKIFKQENARGILGLPDDKTILLFFGQIKKVKGVGVLLDAFSEVCRQRDDIYLVIAGSVWNDNFDIYNNKIQEYNLINNVRCDIRYIKDEEISYYYSACDLNVLPYLDVYQSGVVQLAYAYEKPVIATNIGAFREIVLDGESGFLCEPNNSNSLVKTIYTALEKKDSFARMGQVGNQYIKKKFSWEDIVSKIIKLYKR